MISPYTIYSSTVAVNLFFVNCEKVQPAAAENRSGRVHLICVYWLALAAQRHNTGPGEESTLNVRTFKALRSRAEILCITVLILPLCWDSNVCAVHAWESQAVSEPETRFVGGRGR